MGETLIVNASVGPHTLTSMVLLPVAVDTKSWTSRDKKPRTLENRPCWPPDMVGGDANRTEAYIMKNHNHNRQGGSIGKESGDGDN